MDSGLSTSVYFGLSFSIAIFIYNIAEFYLAGRQGIKVISVTTLLEAGFRFFRFKKNGVIFTLGWLPVGSILKNDAQNGPEEFTEPDSKAKLRKIKFRLALSMLIGVLLCILLIDYGLNGFKVMAAFLSDCSQLVLGTINFKQFFELFVKLSHNINPIFFSLSLIILLLLISEFFTLMVDSKLKYLGYIIMLAFMYWYVVFFYKLLIQIDLKSLAGFYVSCLVSSALLLFISSLIISKNK